METPPVRCGFSHLPLWALPRKCPALCARRHAVGTHSDFFQPLEKPPPFFPTIGKIQIPFSNHWKNAHPRLSANFHRPHPHCHPPPACHRIYITPVATASVVEGGPPTRDSISCASHAPAARLEAAPPKAVPTVRENSHARVPPSGGAASCRAASPRPASGPFPPGRCDFQSRRPCLEPVSPQMVGRAVPSEPRDSKVNVARPKIADASRAALLPPASHRSASGAPVLPFVLSSFRRPPSHGPAPKSLACGRSAGRFLPVSRRLFALKGRGCRALNAGR